MGGPSIRLVVPYFGRRPSYFPLVVRSMARNPDIQWLMVTDAPVPAAPPNLSVELSSFDVLAERVQSHFDFELALRNPYKLCDLRPAFGEIFGEELSGYDFWGHSDLDVIFGRIREHLGEQALSHDKVLVRGSFALYRNSPEASRWFRHEARGISYRDVFSDPAARHFDEWAGIYRLLRSLGVQPWHEENMFDLSLRQYRTRANHPPGRDPRRYAWEDGEVCEYRVARGRVERRTGMLVHLQKRRMRRPAEDVLASDRCWILPDSFAVQGRVSPLTVAAAHVPTGRDLVAFHRRRLERRRGLRASSRAT